MKNKDTNLIIAIVNRAWDSLNFSGITDKVGLAMDIEAVHKINPLRLDDLLVADQENFNHDICGILRHLNRETGELDNGFSPRFTK